MQNNEVNVRFSDILFSLAKRWKMVVVFSIVGLLAGLAIVALAYVRGSANGYLIRGSFAVSAEVDENRYTGNAKYPTSADYYLAEGMPDAVSYVLKSEKVANDVIESMHLNGVSPYQITSNINLAQYKSTQIIEIELNWPSGEEGVKVMSEILKSCNTRLPEILTIGGIEVIDTPKIIGKVGLYLPGGIPASYMIIITTLMGLACAVLLCIVDNISRPTIINLTDVGSELHLEMIGLIPEDKKHVVHGMESGSDGTEPNAIEEAYRSAAYILQNVLGDDDKQHCLLITSAASGENKSAVASNLSYEIAKTEKRTLLIDLDIYNPEIGLFFEDEPSYNRSINAVYRGDTAFSDAVCHVNSYLDVLPLVLEHNRIPIKKVIGEMLNGIMSKYDYEYVIINASPVGEASDILSISDMVEGALFVIRHDHAAKVDIKDALNKLDKAGIRIIGCIVDEVPHKQTVKKKDAVIRRKAAKTAKPVEMAATVENAPSENEQAPIVQGDEERLSSKEAINALMELGIKGEFGEKDDESGTQS